MPLPNNWTTGGLGGTCVDNQDHVFIVNRQNITDQDKDAGRMAPPVIEIDPEGKVVNSWGDPKVLGDRLHWCHVDKDDNIWVIGSASGFIQKYTHDGSKMLMQIGKSGVWDSSDGTSRGKPLNSSLPQFFFPAAIVVDPQNGDLYVADGETAGGNHRVAVLDASGRFLRQWPLHRTEAEKDLASVPHCIGMSNDALIYVCDRQAHRIQVFDKMGSFKRNIDLPWKFSPANGQLGGTDRAAVVLDFSPDPAQRFMFVVNQNLMVVNIVDRQSGRILSEFGHGSGRYPGQFTTPHGIAVDSKGNVYVAEQEGRRIQRFKPAS
jgi:DNA-binding beta-propeller fold protein YncE